MDLISSVLENQKRNDMTQFIGVTGLPRAGSTLVCQLLAQHPEIQSDNASSPLCTTLVGLRRMISSDPFLLSQLDQNFDSTYSRLTGAMQGFLNGWCETDKKAIVDKNRGWLTSIELLLQLQPNAKLVICVRELGQVYGSIEAQHQKTIMLDFPDHMAEFDRYTRADALFNKERMIGTPLDSLKSIENLPTEIASKCLYIMKFEDLMKYPTLVMSNLYDWLGVSPLEIDPMNLTVGIQESDSHYNMKFPHKQHKQIIPPKMHAIPPTIQHQIESAYKWYYDTYYLTK